MQETKKGGCCVDRTRHVRVDSLRLIRKVTGSPCNYLSSGSDGENRGALSTTRARNVVFVGV